MTDTNLPATSSSGALVTTAKSTFLAKVRAAKASPLAIAPKRDRDDLIAAAVAAARRPRLVLAVDATGSREPAWETAKQVTDTLFLALPGQLDVALAVHGGSLMHTFTEFVADPAILRDRAASVRCRGGQTRLLDILDRVRAEEGVKVVVYIGDVFEESLHAGLAAADALKLRGTRLIVLHDTATGGQEHADVFAQLAGRTGGCVLPFDAAAIDRLREMLEAIAVLAVGGVRLLESKAKAMPGARLLLEHIGGK
jgi:hypothetical protein